MASQKAGEGTNAKFTTDKAAQSRSAEGAREAAEHAQKMGELTLSMEREQATASATLKAASIAERLSSDIHFADEETAIQTTANQQLIAALNHGADDYNNQLKALQDKAAEITRQHTVTVAGLTAKASEAQYRQDLQDLVTNEQGKIEATQRGSSQRLAAIDAALKEEASKNLQSADSYRDLLKQKNEVQQQFDEEARKLSAEAGKEDAANTLKMGELGLVMERQQQALKDSARRVSAQQQAEEELYFANESYNLKMQSMLREQAALDTTSKDYENKLKEIQNKELQLVREHENELSAIRDRSSMDQNQKQQAAMNRFEDMTAQGLSQVLMGHKTFASMMDSIGDQIVSGMLQTAIKSMMTADMDKEKQAASAARTMFLAGAKFPFPANIAMAPVMGAAAFASMMAFQDGTDMVPGIGRGDKVPAMLEPGEGVVPGGVMDNLRKMASSGNMGGGNHYHAHMSPTYHVQALDGSGMEKVLDKHAATLAKHVGNEMRKLNR